MTPQELANKVKRLRELYTGNRANLLEIATINALVDLVAEMREALEGCTYDRWEGYHFSQDEVKKSLTKANALIIGLKEWGNDMEMKELADNVKRLRELNNRVDLAQSPMAKQTASVAYHKEINTMMQTINTFVGLVEGMRKALASVKCAMYDSFPLDADVYEGIERELTKANALLAGLGEQTNE